MQQYNCKSEIITNYYSLKWFA